MASLLVETTKEGTRVVAYYGVLAPYVNGGWCIEDYQIMCDWRIGFAGGVEARPIRWRGGLWGSTR